MKNQARFVLLIGLLFLAGLACSAGPLNSLFATPTPTSTNTPTVTPSPTPTSTPLPTATPTLTPTPLPTGTVKEEQKDGSIRFIDYDNKFEVTFPIGWTAVSLDADDINKLMSTAAKSNPEFKKTLTMLKGMNPDIFRIFVFDFQKDHLVNGFASNVNITVQNDAITEALPIQTVLDTTAQSLSQVYKGMKIISSKAITTTSNLSIGVIETNWSVATATGSKVPVYERMIIFKTPHGIAMITLATPISLQKTITPEFEQMIDTLKMLGK